MSLFDVLDVQCSRLFCSKALFAAECRLTYSGSEVTHLQDSEAGIQNGELWGLAKDGWAVGESARGLLWARRSRPICSGPTQQHCVTYRLCH